MALPEAPRAAKKPSIRSHHGREFIDDYEWLREKENPEVIAHLEAENAYTELTARHLEGLRETVFEEIKGRVQETDLGVPTREGGYWYYSRTAEGKQYGIQCRLPITSADDWTPPTIEAGVEAPGEQVIFDGNVESAGHDFFSLGSFDVSADGRLLAYAVDLEGAERYTLRVRDLSTGSDLGDVITETAPGATFDASGRFLFYPTVDESWRPDTIWRHEVGTSTDDVSIFHEDDDRYWIGVGLTRSRQYLLIEVGSKITSETWLLDSSDPTGEFRVVWPRRDGVEYEIDHAIVDGSDRLLILHNEGATGFELVDVPADRPEASDDRRVVIAHRDDRRLESVEAFAGHLLVDFRADGLSQIGLIALPGDGSGFGDLEILGFDEALFTAGWSSNPEFTQATARFGFTSFVTPSTVLDLDVASRERRVLKQQTVLGDYSPPTTTRAASGPQPQTARACPCRWSGRSRSRLRGLLRPSTSTATAPTSTASTRVSASRACRCSTAASCSPWPTCAAVAKWAATGTRTARRSPSATPSPTSSRWPITSSRPGGRRRSGWSRRAAARAGC
ncbi:hypothetical protein GCM10025867_23360 [Frondihabitans sucicola]|uniref:Peptidase S9A N-terminal domain-containing protein n=1 Tax=Frondihabitans sucicola TaxID=1268041 RepID=A0ABN6XYK8_9MICO|nr:hypothetical protein GCM10025867_23360 [Frondihabitans sucicola]